MSWVWAYRVNFFGGLGGLSCLSFFPTLAVYLSAGRSAEAGGREEGREGKEERRKEGKSCFGGKLLVRIGKGLGGTEIPGLSRNTGTALAKGKIRCWGSRVAVGVMMVRHGWYHKKPPVGVVAG